MRHTIDEDPVTHKFALIALPSRFIDGDKLPIPQSIRWFNTRAEGPGYSTGVVEAG